MDPNNASKKTNSNPNKNLVIPEWITPTYFQGILDKDFPGFKSILNFEPVAATSPGENYISIMVRVHCDLLLQDGATEKVSYILKTSLVNSPVLKFIKNMSPFPKEREVYGTLIPKFEQMYAEAGKSVQFGPTVKHFEKCEERETIVMEDLKQRNFKNIDRFVGFDLAHIEVVLKKLAEFHAASAVHHERFGPYSKHFNLSFVSPENRGYVEKANDNRRQHFLSAMKTWTDCEKYIKLWPKTTEVLDWFEKYDVADPSEFNVLNHGDFWSNNVMFQYNDQGEINETLLVDYQLCKWGTPAQDLYYLITSSPEYDIRLNEYNRFLRIYQEHLAENLEVLKYSKAIPSLKDIHILMIKYSPWGVFTAMSILPTISMDTDETASMEKVLIDEEFKKKSYMTPRYVRILKQLLPWWENRGMLQIN